MLHKLYVMDSHFPGAKMQLFSQPSFTQLLKHEWLPAMKQMSLATAFLASPSQ